MKENTIHGSYRFSMPETVSGNRNYRYAAYDKYVATKLFNFDMLPIIVTCRKMIEPILVRSYIFRVLTGKIANIIQELAWCGDAFFEIVSDKNGPLIFNHLPFRTVYRLQTTRGETILFQQSLRGPDYSVVAGFKTPDDIISFHPDTVVHMSVNRGLYHPYGAAVFDQNNVLGKPVFDKKFYENVVEGFEDLISRFN